MISVKFLLKGVSASAYVKFGKIIDIKILHEEITILLHIFKVCTRTRKYIYDGQCKDIYYKGVPINIRV